MKYFYFLFLWLVALCVTAWAQDTYASQTPLIEAREMADVYGKLRACEAKGHLLITDTAVKMQLAEQDGIEALTYYFSEEKSQELFNYAATSNFNLYSGYNSQNLRELCAPFKSIQF